MDPIVIDLFCLIASPFIGSFLSTLVVRIPEGRGWVRGRSACPQCVAVLGPRDLIPLISWAVSHGQCRHCAAPISRLYPIVELAALLVAVMAVMATDGVQTLFGCVLGWTLLTIAAIDLRTQTIPNMLSLPLIALGVVANLMISVDHALASGAGAVAGGAFFWLIAHIFQRIRGKPGLGGGDIKLFAAAGAWVSWQGLPMVLLIASLTGLAMALVSSAQKGDTPLMGHRIPFGPAIALGIWVVWLVG